MPPGFPLFWEGGGEVAGGDGVADEGLGEIPQGGGPGGDVGVAGEDAVGSDAVALPGGTLGVGVEQHGVEAVAGGGETGLRGGAGLELIPQGAKLDGLIGGKEAEDAVGGEALAGMLIYHASGVVGEGVAGVDFDEVVDEEHFENAQDVEGEGVGVFGEHDDHEAEVPGVLGVAFGAAAVEQVGLAEDFFEFIDLEDEGDLVAETVERRRGRDGHRVRGDVTGALPSFSLPVWGRDCSLTGPCP